MCFEKIHNSTEKNEFSKHRISKKKNEFQKGHLENRHFPKKRYEFRITVDVLNPLTKR
jgi:hypothetical protein